jgi:hypothetical protein
MIRRAKRFAFGFRQGIEGVCDNRNRKSPAFLQLD